MWLNAGSHPIGGRHRLVAVIKAHSASFVRLTAPGPSSAGASEAQMLVNNVNLRMLGRRGTPATDSGGASFHPAAAQHGCAIFEITGHI